jgi:hypothetical protein
MEADYRALDGGGVGVRHHGDHGGVLVRPVAEGRGDSAVWSEQTGRGPPPIQRLQSRLQIGPTGLAMTTNGSALLTYPPSICR